MFYDPSKIEPKWQEYWLKNNIFKPKDFDTKRKKLYHLVMFVYPSGDLHVGHWYNFAPADTLARFKFMQGYNVLSPMGFDAFGLPAENAAIQRKIDPAKWTEENISTMRKQLRSIGPIYDWDREVLTNDPNYYKWTQWIFLQLYKKGLAYRTKALANWCPVDQTVLANEQVINGHCERDGAQVVQKEIDQWVFKITDYAERLLEDLDKIDWPERTKIMQRNWIGRSEGRFIEFRIKNTELRIQVFTTRPDTIKGVTYMVLAPEHQLVQQITTSEQRKTVDEYVDQARKKTDRERQMYDKSGVPTGAYVVNPVTKEEIPIWVADYVLMGYGTGAIMAVPMHDERDKQFAQQNNLPLGSGELIDPKGVGTPQVQYRLRDWIVSRQRYWGVPIPILYCDECGIQPVPENQLPVELPKIKDYLPKGKPPLATASKDWFETICPNCEGKATREVETMDTFVDSSWYFLRYTDPQNSKRFADAKLVKYWCPVDIYIGGAEHTVLHLLYARFITKVMKDLGYIEFDEPFLKLRHQGTILGPDRQKMSKSRGNVIDPDEIVKKYGSDTVRMFLMFMGPYEQGGPWSPTGITGIFRFLKRASAIAEKVNTTTQLDPATAKIIEKTLAKVTDDLERLHFNTAIAALMVLTNHFETLKSVPQVAYQQFLQMLAPFAPHLAEELWSKVDGGESVFAKPWPKVARKPAKQEPVAYLVQINGKLRAKFEAQADLDEVKATAMAKQLANISALLKGKRITKTVYVPSRLVNFVLQ